MIRPDKIKSSMFGRVGFNQSTLTGYNIVDSNNLASASGSFFQDVNFLITIKNIKELQENSSITDVQFNALLKSMQEAVILDTCNKVIEGQSSFVQSNNFYPFEKTFGSTLNVADKMACFRIKPNYQNNLISKISFIELCFDSAVTFNVYLFNSNKPNTPIQTESVTTVANESVIKSLDWYISDDVEYKGGVFYLGYFEEDLGSAKPIARDFELSSLEKSTRCYEILPVKIDHSGNTIDVSSSTTTSDTGGLNLGVEIYNDYTQLIVRNKNIFDHAIQTQMAIKVLNLISNSTRSNNTQRINTNIVDSARAELHGMKDQFGNVVVEGMTIKNYRAIRDLKNMLFYRPKISVGTLR